MISEEVAIEIDFAMKQLLMIYNSELWQPSRAFYYFYFLTSLLY